MHHRLTNGGRKQFVPLVKVTSEARLLKRLRADLAAELAEVSFRERD